MGNILIIALIVLSLLPCCRGDDLETYKWISIVDDQWPNVSHACETEFGSRFDTKATFYDLLYYEPESRKEMCKALQPRSKDFDECSPIEEVAIENLLCYEYDVNDASTPPISKLCAIRYWQCSNTQEFFFDWLSKKHQKQLCSKHKYYLKCFTATFSFAMFCDLTKSEICGDIHPEVKKDMVAQGCTSDWQICFSEDYSAVFETLQNMKQYTDQLYVCGRLEECLVDTNLDGATCSRNEARAAEEFLCSNTTFTPDTYGLFLLDEDCRESFYQCYNQTSIPDLQTDPIKRKTLCQARRPYKPCFYLSECTILQNEIINDFLCYDLNDTMLLVSASCRQPLVYCASPDKNSPLVDITDLEMLGPDVKQAVCKKLTDVWKCVDDFMVCTDNERTYFQNHVCVTSCSMLPMASGTVTGLVLFLAFFV